MFYAYSDTRTYPHHICIREIKRHLQYFVQTFKKKKRSVHFLNTKSHTWAKNPIYIINQAIVLNKHVYLLKIKLLIQQIQSHFFLLHQLGNILAWVQEWINFNMILFLSWTPFSWEITMLLSDMFILGRNAFCIWNTLSFNEAVKSEHF